MYIGLGTLSALLLLFCLIGLTWFWSDSLRARELVIQRCRKLCDDIDVQFLDETVALYRLRLRRSPTGKPAFVRFYRFEYSQTGSDRWPGYAVLHAGRLQSVQLQGPEGLTILDAQGHGSRTHGSVDSLPSPPPPQKPRLH